MSVPSTIPEGSEMHALYTKQKFHRTQIIRLSREIDDLMETMRALNFKTFTTAGTSQEGAPKVSDADFVQAMITMQLRPFSQ
jgi:hypothetical protein